MNPNKSKPRVIMDKYDLFCMKQDFWAVETTLNILRLFAFNSQPPSALAVSVGIYIINLKTFFRLFHQYQSKIRGTKLRIYDISRMKGNSGLPNIIRLLPFNRHHASRELRDICIVMQ